MFVGYKPGGSDISQESRALSALAMEREPNNSMVLALVANSMIYLENRPDDALTNAFRAVELNPGNPFAWWTLAAVQLANQKPAEAYASAVKSKWLFRGSSVEFLPEAILGGSALLIGNDVEAPHHFERSLSLRPTFKPALRYTLGLMQNKEA